MRFSTIVSAFGAGVSTVAAMDDETFYNLELPEFTPDGDQVVDLRFSSALDRRSGCGNVPGIANGECVPVGTAFTYHCRYKPTCAGNCYVDKFHLVKISGDGTYSTNCVLFSDTNCQNKIEDFGSQTGPGKCKNADGWSMKCYYRC